MAMMLQRSGERRSRTRVDNSSKPSKYIVWVIISLVSALIGSLVSNYNHQSAVFTVPTLLQSLSSSSSSSLSSEQTTTSISPSLEQEQQQQQLLLQQQHQQQQLLLQNYLIPLAIPQGEAIALPSLRTTQNETSTIDRSIYGGTGDKVHLGGFIDIDVDGLSPAAWKDMVKWYGIHSIMDVGCGRGISTTWFITHGVDALCIEGSSDARRRTVLTDPATQMIEHDYSRGPWWPPKTYDAVWCVEFLEHVGRNFHQNYLPTFRKAALIFATHSRWGGWHHVEVHNNNWWILKFESYGFKYSELLTNRTKQMARTEQGVAPNGEPYRGSHIKMNLQVFINPMVASLPEHAHLFTEPGCFKHYGLKDNNTAIDYQNAITRNCRADKGETPLPDRFQHLPLKMEMDREWEQILRKHINLKAKTEKVIKVDTLTSVQPET